MFYEAIIFKFLYNITMIPYILFIVDKKNVGDFKRNEIVLLRWPGVWQVKKIAKALV
jgi:hypothetical protein